MSYCDCSSGDDEPIEDHIRKVLETGLNVSACRHCICSATATSLIHV